MKKIVFIIATICALIPAHNFGMWQKMQDKAENLYRYYYQGERPEPTPPAPEEAPEEANEFFMVPKKPESERGRSVLFDEEQIKRDEHAQQLFQTAQNLATRVYNYSWTETSALLQPVSTAITQLKKDNPSFLQAYANLENSLKNWQAKEATVAGANAYRRAISILKQINTPESLARATALKRTVDNIENGLAQDGGRVAARAQLKDTWKLFEGNPYTEARNILINISTKDYSGPLTTSFMNDLIK